MGGVSEEEISGGPPRTPKHMCAKESRRERGIGGGWQRE